MRIDCPIKKPIESKDRSHIFQSTLIEFMELIEFIQSKNV